MFALTVKVRTQWSINLIQENKFNFLTTVKGLPYKNWCQPPDEDVFGLSPEFFGFRPRFCPAGLRATRLSYCWIKIGSRMFSSGSLQ